MSFNDQIIKGLKDRFQFKKTSGDWLQEGKCPACNKAQVYCAAKEPKVLKCGRVEKCGWEASVRDQLPDLFENWSDRFKRTEADPNAAADAYLLNERGLDLRLLRGSYAQELYRDRDTGQTGATVRFTVGETYWERIIDKPGRFGKKAHFGYGGKWRGHAWVPPRLDMDQLAAAKEIWIAEGIFDATALCQVGKVAVSAMSVNVWPEYFFADLRKAIEASGRADRPRIVWAFDVGNAGVTWTKKFVERAEREGWDSTAAQVRPDGEGTKLDWNDLLLRHLSHKGDDRAENGAMGEKAFDEYLWNGAVTIAATPVKKARLIFERKGWGSFDFRHGNRLWWCKVRSEKDEDGETNQRLDVDEIANCAFRLLYRERDEVVDETNYFLQIDFPDQATVKARFSNNAVSNSAEFKKRLMAFAGMWRGTQEQLDRIVASQIRKLTKVEPLPFTGYSPKHKAWVLGDLAVQDGRLYHLNSEQYFELAGGHVKLRSPTRLLDITYEPDQLTFDWLPDFWEVFGPKGAASLAFWVMSLFAVQIRKWDGSVPFLEVTGDPGSGKTAMLELLWMMMGRPEWEGLDPNKATNAGLARTYLQVSNLPVGLVEGNRNEDDKRGHQRGFDYNELLVLYNGRSPRTIGAKTSGFEIIDSPFQGTIYLTQNNRIEAQQAVLERLVSMVIDKSRHSPARREIAGKLKRTSLAQMSGTIVHIVRQEAAFLKFFFERSAHHEKEMPKREGMSGLYNDRITKNHSQLAAAAEALPKLFPNFRPEWAEETVDLIDQLALNRQISIGGDHPLVAGFWEKVDHLIGMEKLGDHAAGVSLNQSRDPETTIAINLIAFEARCRHAGLNVPDMDALRKLLRQSKSRKFRDNKTVNNPAGRGVKCWVFAQPVTVAQAKAAGGII